VLLLGCVLSARRAVSRRWQAAYVEKQRDEASSFFRGVGASAAATASRGSGGVGAKHPSSSGGASPHDTRAPSESSFKYGVFAYSRPYIPPERAEEFPRRPYTHAEQAGRRPAHAQRRTQHRRGAAAAACGAPPVRASAPKRCLLAGGR
jgi:hypothetical protein